MVILKTGPGDTVKGKTRSELFAGHMANIGRLADENGLAQNVQKLSSGLSLDIVAHHLVSSAEFQNRHGSQREVDTKYVTALYRDALGRKPQPEELEFWLAEAKRGATRANPSHEQV